MIRILFAVLFLTVLAVPASAADAPALKAVVVDVQKILKESTAAQDIRKQLDAQRDKYQTEIKAEEQKLRAAEQEIVKSRDKLTKEQLAEKQNKLREDFRKVEAQVQQRRKALDSAFAQGMKKIHDALAQIVIDAAKVQKANAVLPKAGTMWHAPEMEITDSVLKGLNAKLPSVKVTITEGAAAKN
ncbi:MAG: OmpH family outer membrane protein [Bdellovibrionales bacterium]